jgi:hypothetical protein
MLGNGVGTPRRLYGEKINSVINGVSVVRFLGDLQG